MHAVGVNPRKAIACLLLVCVAALSLYLYSSLHKHNPFSGRPCAFSQVEKSPALGWSDPIELPLPAECVDSFPREGRCRSSAGISPTPVGRAPPTNS